MRKRMEDPSKHFHTEEESIQAAQEEWEKLDGLVLINQLTA
jgi:hypothetical protein